MVTTALPRAALLRAITLHGFRSSFRDWAAENDVRKDLAEMALAHKIGNAVEQAYNRTALVEQRRAVMERWASFVYGDISPDCRG
jgi:integrase